MGKSVSSLAGIDPAALVSLCMRYDEKYGAFPKSVFEGAEMLKFFFEELEKEEEEKRAKNIEREPITLELGPHDIATIPAASLWELCRDYDAKAGGGKYVGLQLFVHFKRIMEH